LSPSAIGVTLLPVRGIYKRSLSRGELAVNPTTGLAMPAVRGGRDRIASPEECERLLEALPKSDRPLWATAMYAGLRRGELRALRIEDVNLASGVIRVSRGWDHDEGEIATKNRKERRVPITAALRDYLDQHTLRLREVRVGDDNDLSEDERGRIEKEWLKGLVFGASAVSPFSPSPLRHRAAVAWRTAGLDPITLHECRHTFASLMIAAGVNVKALSTYMGHSTVAFTLDKYGHLMPGNEDEAASMLDAYLARAGESVHRTTAQESERQGAVADVPDHLPDRQSGSVTS
jgi:integrase